MTNEEIEKLINKWEVTGLLRNKKTFLSKQILAEKLEKEARKIVDEKTYNDFELKLIEMKEDGWFDDEI